MAEIRLERLTKRFGDVQALHKFSLDIRDGAFVALLGPSGCGKSTTLNLIAGLEKPTAGEIYFDDHPVSRVPAGRRGVGLVFQNYAVFSHMTVFENIAFGLRVRRPRPSSALIDRDVRRTAKLLSLGHVLDRKAGALSVNELQKVALGRAMIVTPAIFLMDEPLSNLDAAFRGYMRAELKRIQRELGQTMVYVTHDQVEAMSMAEAIAVMDHGVLQQYGTPEDVYRKPANRFVAGFVGSVSMNFVPSRCRVEDGRLVAEPIAVQGPRMDLPTSSALARTTEVTLAWRPELSRLVAASTREAYFRGEVRLVEQLGPNDVVHVVMNGMEVRVVTPREQRPRHGETVGVAVDPGVVHLFDATTGMALN